MISASTSVLFMLKIQGMNVKSFPRPEGQKPRRWIEALKTLSRERGNNEAVALRALELARQLNVAPWIALGVAERLITLKEAQVLDRAGRCRELQSAVLDKRRSLSELKTLLPYAAHFLATELMDAQPARKWDVRVVIRILEGVLSSEVSTKEEGMSMRVRTRPFNDYVADVERVLGIMRRTRCDVVMALDVAAGRVDEAFAADYIRRKRDLEKEERQGMTPSLDARNGLPPRREVEPGRRPVFHQPDDRHPYSGPGRDHWPRREEKKEPG